MSVPESTPTAAPVASTSQVQLNPTQQATYDLITGRLQEVLGEDIIKEKLSRDEQLKCYWGTATTGRPHIGYFVPFTKIADFLNAGVEVKVLLAIHAFLDAGKATYETVAHRVKYYSKLLHVVFTSLGVPTDKLIFVTGSDYQLGRDYSLDNFRLCAITSLHDASKAGAEVVKQSDSPFLSSLLYPGMQALDEQYLGVDFQFGGVDQRKIFVMAGDVLPRLGYAKRAHLMNEMVPGLAGGKMSSSDPNSKIDFLDSAADVKKKIKAAFCEEKNITENGLLAFFKAVLFPIQRMRKEQMKERGEDAESKENKEKIGVAGDAPSGALVSIPRDERFGGPVHYSAYKEMEEDFAAGGLHPGDLKKVTTDLINQLLEPIRQAFEKDESFKEAEKAAYPPPPAPVKFVKKSKQEKKAAAGKPGKDSAEAFIERSKEAAQGAEGVAPDPARAIMAEGVASEQAK